MSTSKTMSMNKTISTKKTMFAVIAVALAATLCGCSTPGAPEAARSASTRPESSPLSVVDGTGTTVELPQPASRFAVLDPSSIEVLKDLGEDDITYGSGERQFVQMVFGPAADRLHQIGGSWEQPDVEGIVASHPDLVIGDAYPHAQIKPALSGVAPMYLISRSGGYQQAMKDFINLGVLTGHEPLAQRNVNSFMDDLNAAVRKSPKNQTSLIIWGQSATDFSVPTQDDPSASVLGAISNYPWGGHGAQAMNVSLDSILEVNPDVIFVESLGRLDDPRAPSLSSQMAANPVWRTLKAVRDQRVYEVNPEVWHSDRGGLGLKKTLDQAMPMLYPGLGTR
jgi:iron complex transport system substrate-binding protein